VITNFRRVRSAPYIVGGLLAVLVVVSIANLMTVGVRHRGRDLAVVRAFGADRRWVAVVEHWHALLVVIVVGGLSALVGVVVGRLLFTWRVTDRVGAADDTFVPVVTLLVGLVVLVAVADLVGQLAARRGSRSVARELATE
jgi:ABC-type lipoprotein release transport system permease subunit